MDMISCGLPCHPFTDYRVKSDDAPAAKATTRRGAPKKHPEYTVVMEGFRKLLEKRRPGSPKSEMEQPLALLICQVLRSQRKLLALSKWWIAK